MACPYFIPAAILEGDLFPQRQRLPLGEGFRGSCCAGAECYEPSVDELRTLCNLGYPRQYAERCPRCPLERDWDAVRLGCTRDEETRLVISFACERDFLPVESGELIYEIPAASWTSRHADVRVQSKAEAFVQAYLARRPRAIGATP